MSSRKPETGNLTIDASAKSQPISVGPCNYLYCYDQTALVQITLYKNRQEVETHIMERLTNLPGKDFDEFIIENLSGSSNTVRFFFGRGEYVPNADRSVVVIDDSTPPLVEIDDTVPVEVNIAGGSVTLNSDVVSGSVLSVPDVACASAATTAVVTANASNTTVRVTNPDTSTLAIRVGTHSGVGAANGSIIYPGQMWEAKTKCGVWVYNPNAGSINVAVEVERA